LEAQFSSKTVKSGDLNGPAFPSQKATAKLNKFWNLVLHFTRRF